jgi:hypothetical protein
LDASLASARHIKLGLLISREAYFPGSDFIIATAINDDGVIVGLYFDKQSVSHGFKALPKDKQ